jgi:uncharacterized protein
MPDTVLVLIIVLSAYFVRGITGFGSGMIAVPLLALSHPLQFAVPLVLALDFTASSMLGGATREKTDWAEIRALLPYGVIGACLGTVALLKLPSQQALLALGAFVVFSGLRDIFGARPVGQISRAWAIPTGIIGGTVGALFGTSAPPYIVYLTHRLRDRNIVRATFSWLFIIDGGFRLFLFLIAGLLLQPDLQIVFALSLVPMGMGLYAGDKVHLDVTSEGMLKVVGALVVSSGAMLFVKVLF